MLLRKPFRSALIISVSALITGCVSLGLGLSWSEINQYLENKVANKASFEHDCPKENIRVTKLDGYTFGAKGCGLRSTYVLIPNQRCRSGIWSEKYIDSFCHIVTNSRH